MRNIEEISTAFQLGGVIPTKAEIHRLFSWLLDFRLRGDDTTWWLYRLFPIKETLFQHPFSRGEKASQMEIILLIFSKWHYFPRTPVLLRGDNTTRLKGSTHFFNFI